MKKLTLIIALSLISIKANAFVISNPNERKLVANKAIRTGTILCPTSEGVQEMMIANTNGDERAEQYIFKTKRCFRTKERWDFSFLDIVNENTIFTPHKILLYRGKKIEKVYTAGFALLENYNNWSPSEAID